MFTHLPSGKVLVTRTRLDDHRSSEEEALLITEYSNVDLYSHFILLVSQI